MLLILFRQKSDSIVSPNNKTLFFPLLLGIEADEDEEIGIAGAGEAYDGDEEKGELLPLFIFLVDDDDDDDDEEIISIGDSAFLFVCLGLLLRR